MLAIYVFISYIEHPLASGTVYSKNLKMRGTLIMKRIAIVTFALMLFCFSCTKNAESPRYAADSPEFEFFKKLSEKDPRLNPEKVVVLISTSKFKITNNDVMPDIHRQLVQYSGNLDNYTEENIREFTGQIAESQAMRKLLVYGARDRNISVEDSTVQSRLDQIFAANGGKEAFLEQIERYGFTLEYVEQDIRDNLLASKFSDAVIAEVKISEEEILKAYGEDKTATVRHILKMTQNKSDSLKKIIYAEMEDILAKARAGEDFAELAIQFSEDTGSKDNGGLLENFPRGYTVKPFEDAAFTLPVNSISDIVETMYGYHILQIVSRERETRPLEEARAEIEANLRSTKQRDAYNNRIEELKEKYNYTIL